MTLHRQENVDVPERLAKFVAAFEQLVTQYDMPLVWSVHPRTKKRLKEQGIEITNPLIKISEPLGLFDFVHLEQNAFCVLTDSGTVQEECCIFHIPTVTIRDVTERPETIDAGSNIISGAESEDILRCVKTMISQKTSWIPPQEYLAGQVSDTVIKILLGKGK